MIERGRWLWEKVNTKWRWWWYSDGGGQDPHAGRKRWYVAPSVRISAATQKRKGDIGSPLSAELGAPLSLKKSRLSSDVARWRACSPMQLRRYKSVRSIDQRLQFICYSFPSDTLRTSSISNLRFLHIFFSAQTNLLNWSDVSNIEFQVQSNLFFVALLVSCANDSLVSNFVRDTTFGLKVTYALHLRTCTRSLFLSHFRVHLPNR